MEEHEEHFIKDLKEELILSLNFLYLFFKNIKNHHTISIIKKIRNIKYTQL